MPEANKQPPWWRSLFSKEALGGHVVNTLVGLSITFVLGLLVTLFWVAVAAWSGSYVWTQRFIGAAMAFGVVVITTAMAIIFLRRRLSPPIRHATEKGYLDFQTDSAKARDEILRIQKKITGITQSETRQIKANIEKLNKIATLLHEKQLPAKLKNSKRSARATDRVTDKINAIVPTLAAAIETYSKSELAYWTWRSSAAPPTLEEAAALLSPMRERLRGVSEYIQSLVDSRKVTEQRKGVSQALNDATDRRLKAIDRLISAEASQQEPWQKIIAQLEKVTNQQTDATEKLP